MSGCPLVPSLESRGTKSRGVTGCVHASPCLQAWLSQGLLMNMKSKTPRSPHPAPLLAVLRAGGQVAGTPNKRQEKVKAPGELPLTLCCLRQEAALHFPGSLCSLREKSICPSKRGAGAPATRQSAIPPGLLGAYGHHWLWRDGICQSSDSGGGCQPAAHP